MWNEESKQKQKKRGAKQNNKNISSLIVCIRRESLVLGDQNNLHNISRYNIKRLQPDGGEEERERMIIASAKVIKAKRKK